MKHTYKHRLELSFMVGLGVIFNLTILCLLDVLKALISDFARYSFFLCKPVLCWRARCITVRQWGCQHGWGKRSEESVCSGKGAAPRDMSAESTSYCSVKHRYGNCECQVSAFGKEFPLAEQFSVPPA